MVLNKIVRIIVCFCCVFFPNCCSLFLVFGLFFANSNHNIFVLCLCVKPVWFSIFVVTVMLSEEARSPPGRPGGEAGGCQSLGGGGEVGRACTQGEEEEEEEER